MQGKQISGYTLQRPLGTGGMAEVWYAENKIGKKAAVKLLLPKLCQDENVKSRFLTEAKVMVDLNHPNIRQVYDYGDIDGTPAIVMEYLEGDDLKARMKRGQHFTDEELKRWWNQLVDALNYTHQKGVVHRDLKPGNIFVDREGNIKLLDFGIAKVRESISSTQTGQKLGTLMYMSPEQVKDSKHIDYRTDLYSLAVTFVHLLTGKRPYDSDTSSDFEISEQIVYKPLNLNGLPKDWRDFLTPYLEKEPQNRPELRYFEVNAAGKPKESYNKAKNAVEPDEDEGTMVESPVAPTPRPQPKPKPVTQQPVSAPKASTVAGEKPKSKTGLWVGVGIAALALLLFLLLKPGSNSDSYSNSYSDSYPTTNYSDPSPQVISSTTTEEQYSTPQVTQEYVTQEDDAPYDAVKGLFSVGSSKKVYFSKGNLQYRASTDTWRFAEKQWKYMGSSNANISQTYSGWIDLFGWGTGDNPTNSSKDEYDYPYFNDWGTYGMGNDWRTLSADEWDYLFNLRKDASLKRGAAIVNGVAGIVILPDNWVKPSGCSFSTEYRSKDYSMNTYSGTDWQQMEDAGAVFLPASGRRDGTQLFHQGTDGDYWSSTSHRTSGRAYNIDFCDAKVTAKDHSKTKQAFAVRLVKDK